MLTFVAAGEHVWGTACLSRFADPRVLALEGETIAAMVNNLRRAIPSRASLIAHDVAGLVALTLAYESPELVRSVSVVSSTAAAPTGDSVANYTLAYPPQPVPSRASCRWAIERLSYAHHHIDDALLDDYASTLGQLPPPDLMPAKAKFFEACRERGFPVPAQVVWGTHDPLGSIDLGLWLFRIIASKQKVTHFHVINRAGSLPFREEPDAFHQVVSAFVESA